MSKKSSQIKNYVQWSMRREVEKLRVNVRKIEKKLRSEV